ncbi:hypothetical protein O6H91_22G003800 [Diphasiastrum complanatum]|uniref:Uncharacterized protein n=3 Tax=Diphasiastrum complanatum TaxID=34168 RepID=A0ACC2ACC7_DIPCM|nr:hypothetical protein O6H91_22G003800 [Diphasiastrum complanatum]KAJ7515181.1 hypothetical protein O6H91_22G003800 [Diphasiastrum complanatum]KAJ7515182.1 hypothetical protein O6H91_22G003800 [Diphasiastrum complanatum]
MSTFMKLLLKGRRIPCESSQRDCHEEQSELSFVSQHEGNTSINSYLPQSTISAPELSHLKVSKVLAHCTVEVEKGSVNSLNREEKYSGVDVEKLNFREGGGQGACPEESLISIRPKPEGPHSAEASQRREDTVTGKPYYESEMDVEEYKGDKFDTNHTNTNANEAYLCVQDYEHSVCVNILDNDNKLIDPAEPAVARTRAEVFVLQINNGGIQGEKHVDYSPMEQVFSRPVEPESLLGPNGGTLYCARTCAESLADCCRICQQNTEEPLLELGCQCRGELSKAHRFCIEHWFGNKGSNKCEICQSIATNIPAPATQPTQKFWIWRISGRNGAPNVLQRSRDRARFHPLWVALLILIVGLLFDVLISVFLGASALPINIIIGVLVVLGIGTAARLIVECWHEHDLRRNIARVEMNLQMEQLERDSNGNIHSGPMQNQNAVIRS